MTQWKKSSFLDKRHFSWAYQTERWIRFKQCGSRPPWRSMRRWNVFRNVIASAWALLSLIFCSVKSPFPLIMLSLNLFNRQLYKPNKHGNCINVSTHRMTMWRTPPPLSCEAYHVTNSSDAIGHFLRYLRQITTCSISLASQVWTLRCVRCVIFYARNFSCVALRSMHTLHALRA